MNTNNDEINETIQAMMELFEARKFSNGAILNAVSKVSVHLAFVFGISKEVYLKDLGIMFDERIKRAVEEVKAGEQDAT
jgi:hypothetical protein